MTNPFQDIKDSNGDKLFTEAADFGGIVSHQFNTDISAYQLPPMAILSGNDDNRVTNVDIGFEVSIGQFKGRYLTLDNNGFFAFEQGVIGKVYPAPNYVPHLLGSSGYTSYYPMLCGIWQDIDTRPTLSGKVRYGQTTIGGKKAFVAQWPLVGYYNQHMDKVNSFDMRIIERPGGYHFELFIYKVEWEQADVSQVPGILGLWDGSQVIWQHPNNSSITGLLDSNPTGATHNNYGTSLNGKYVFDGIGGTGPYVIQVNYGSGGSISPSNNYSVPVNSTPSYTVTANTNFAIQDVTVDNVSVLTSPNYNSATGVYTFDPIHANHTITAGFVSTVPAYHTITVTPGANGTITPGTSAYVARNSTPAYVIAPSSGYEISDVLVDGSSVLSSGNYNATTKTYTFPAVTANHTITSVYTALPDNISLHRLPNMPNLLPVGHDNKLQTPIGFTVDFGIFSGTKVVIDSNGYICFVAGGIFYSYDLTNFIPKLLTDFTMYYPMVGGIWNNINLDTNWPTGSVGGGNIYYGQTVIDGVNAFVVQYKDVQPLRPVYLGTPPVNDFDIRILEKPGGYHFEVYIYSCGWDMTDYSDGAGGASGIAVHNGNNVVYQHPGSLVGGGLLDSNPTGLTHSSYGSGLDGKYVFIG